MLKGSGSGSAPSDFGVGWLLGTGESAAAAVRQELEGRRQALSEMDADGALRATGSTSHGSDEGGCPVAGAPGGGSSTVVTQSTVAVAVALTVRGTAGCLAARADLPFEGSRRGKS